MRQQEMGRASIAFILLICLSSLYLNPYASACRIGSERIKLYIKKSIERVLNAEQLESFYWAEEPFHTEALTKAIGLRVTLAETHFSYAEVSNGNTIVTRNETNRPRLLHDLIISCASDRDRKHTLILNLELNNPFKVIDLHFLYSQSSSSKSQQQEPVSNRTGIIRLRMPQSTLLVRLSQHIRSDDCLDVTYVQLAPNTAYEIECLNCNEMQQKFLDNIFSKKMAQFDSEIDSMVSEKFLLGLRTLLDQQRLDLDLYMN